MNTISSVSTSAVSATRAGVRSPALPPASSGSPAQAVTQSSSPAASGVASAPVLADLSKAVAQIQGYLRDSGKNLSVSFDDSASRYVTVVSSDTGEVIRTIPSEEVLEVARAINEKLGGLINQRA